MMLLIRKYYPILFIFLIWCVFAYPYFGKGLVPYSSTYQVNFFPPWSHFEKYLGPVKNNAMPDIHTQIYPWKKLTIESYSQGQVPFWNPYSFSGNPHLANFQTAVLSPFNILFFIFSFIDAWSILILLQPLLAGLFMYILVFQYQLRREAALLSAICFMFCGFLVVWMAYGTLAYAILYLPLALFSIEKFLSSNNKKYLILLSLAVSLSFFSGHFQTSLYMQLFLLAYIAWVNFREKKLVSTFKLLFAYVLGVFIALPQLLPTVEFYLHSSRSESYITGGGIPWHYLITTLAPDFYGNPVTRNDWFGYYAEWSSFVGIIPLFFALLAIVSRKKKNISFYFFMVCIVLILSIDSFIQPLLGSLKIPVLSTSAPSRIIVLYSFAVSVLAGFGLHIYMEKSYAKKHIILVGALIIVLLLGVWLLLGFGKPFELDKVLVAKRNLILPTGIFAAILVLFSSLQLFPKRFFHIGIWLLLLFASVDSLRFVQKWMPFEPVELVYPDTQVIGAIQKNIGYGRMFGNFGGETAVYYKIPSIEGYDPLYIGRYGEFLSAAGDGKLMPAQRSVANISRQGKHTDKILDMLGVSIFFHPRADTNQAWAYPVWSKPDRYERIYQDDKFELFKNLKALEKATVFFSYTIEKDKQKILDTIFSDTFDIRKDLVLEEYPGFPKNATGSANAVIKEYSSGRIVVEVDSSDEGLLFVPDNYYSGWHVIVNDREEKIYRANYSFRAVKIPKGKSIVNFYYSYF